MKLHILVLHIAYSITMILGFILGSVQYNKNQELNNRIDCLEKQINEYEQRCERMIDTNLDIIVNKRW